MSVVREFYRQSLEKRYDPAALSGLPEFRDLNPSVLEELRQFVLNRLYPPPAERDALDHAFQVVTGMLSNPMKTGRAALALTGILLFHGRHVPFLVRVSGLLIGSYQALRTLEMEMARLMASGRPESGKRGWNTGPSPVVRAASQVDREIYDRFIDGVSAIVDSFSNLRGWEVALEAAAALDGALQREPGVWSSEEREAAALARRLLEDCVHLIRQLSPGQIRAAAKGIRMVETRWVEELSGIARNQTGTD